MRSQSFSHNYPVGAIVLLAVAVLVNQPVVTIVISVIGLVAGVWVLRQGNVQRVTAVAMVGFVAALGMAVFSLLRAH
jgi:uncharacterized membrane protein YozB (DUF420 family)